MDKLLWVTAPLALAVVALGWAAWRGRLPSRTGLNVAFSLLLLVYVLGTAGLGIFWVANQQLPVFDWHYLFGYVTVALLVVHLGFNFRVVWHVLRRALGGGAPQPPAGGSAPQPPLGGSARKPPLGGGARKPPLGGERHAAGLGEQAAAARAARATPADRAAHVSSGRWAGAPTATRRAALRLLGLFGGLAAAAGAGYLLGLRHGRTEIVLPPPPGQTGPAQLGEAGGAATAGQEARQQAWALVERLHGWTSHTRTGVLRRAASPQWALAPAPFKHYPQAKRLALGPPSSAPGDAAARGHPLGTWLWHVAGVSALSGGIAFRTSPSSGALFATELYVQVIDLPGVPPGLWHYDAQGHALEQLHVQGKRTGSALDTAVDLPPGCVAVVLASAVFARSGHKYGDRTYRYVTADLGHALENLRVATQATGMEATPLQQFDDDAMTAHLGLDGRTEAVLAVVAIRPRPARWPDAAAALPAGGAAAPRAAAADRAGSSMADWTPAPWGPAGGTDGTGGTGGTESAGGWPRPEDAGRSERAGLPREESGRAGSDGADTAPRTAVDLTEAFHRATSLRRSPGTRDTPAATAPSAAAASPAEAAAASDSRTSLPAKAEPGAQARLGLIATRRSVRRFASTPVTESALTALLRAMTEPPPLLSTAVRIDVLTVSAQDRPPAAWRLDPGTRRLQQRVEHGGGLRPLARAAGLDQDVIGDAALVFVLSLDRATLLADPRGPARAWRHGFIEAGMVGERLYLAGAALGLGVCAVGAFYDDEASALVGVDPAREWVVHLAGVGVPG